MKNFCLTSIFLFAFFSSVSAQLKHDYVWTIGYGKLIKNSQGTQFGGIIMDFNSVPPSLTLQSYIVDRPRAAISDKSGNLVAYTNGCTVLNRNHDVMVNGDTLNPGDVFNEFCPNAGDYPLWQPCIFLPKPDSDSLYYLFHLRDDDYFWNPMNLLYSIIDASADGGNGAVVSKNNVVLSDSIYLNNYVTATQHGNGQDWWVIVPRRFSNNVHVTLLSPEGVAYKGMQDFDQFNLPVDTASCCSQSGMSADGSKYFRNSPESLMMWDFDRCNGQLSNPVRLDWDSVPFGGGGVAVSPNSRFLYLTSGGTVQQYDLEAPNLAESMQIVAIYDGTIAFNIASFFQMMRGPDGKIYICTSNDNDVWHIIHNPNELGIACNVEQHAIWLPSLSSILMPNFANYNLGPLNPPCDTTGGVGTSQAYAVPQTLKIAPNPTKGFTDVALPTNSGGTLAVYNANGEKITSLPIIPGLLNTRLDLESFPAGFYWVIFSNAAGRILGTAKVALVE